MALVRPRLTDYFGIPLLQEDASFAIPFLDEDTPLCVDPFLLWKSPSQQDQALYGSIINALNHLGHLVTTSGTAVAKELLIAASECEEIGLGFSRTRRGARIGSATADKILALFRDVPQLHSNGFTHLEETQLLVEGIGRDRISDIACSFMKSFLIDFTMDQCDKHSIPMADVAVPFVYDQQKTRFVEEVVKLPVSPTTGRAILLVPKRWLRAVPWISYEDYVDNYYRKEILPDPTKPPKRVEVLDFNRRNYDVVQVYVQARERVQADCRNDPLFAPIPVLSATRKMKAIRQLKTGRGDGADKKYEDLVVQLMASLLYPQLDFAAEQSRTDAGVLIRDLVFYNSQSMPFLKEIHDVYDSTQIVMELKNVHAIDRDHINQLNRYMTESFGRFGIFITRHPLSSAMYKNTISLWAGQRRCIIALTDQDLELMTNVFKSKQRLPVEVIQAKYLRFMRDCPS